METDNSIPVSLHDVYDLAAQIGEHCKKLINQHGSDLDQSLITSVVRVLEYLEEAVLQREDYHQLVDKLHRQIEELQRGQQEKANAQMKFLSDIEDIDDSWRKENIQLSQYVKFLRSENKRLASSLSEKFSQSLTDLKQDDDDDRLKQNNLDKLRSRISLLCKDLKLKNDEIASLKTQNDALIEENQNFRNLALSLQRNSLDTKDDKASVQNVKSHDDTALLEAKIRSLEEELSKMRLKMAEATLDTDNASSPHNEVNNNSEKEEEGLEEEENIKMEDLPVQGPIPKEPDEKLFFRDRKSRIWSFFPRLTRALIK